LHKLHVTGAREVEGAPDGDSEVEYLLQDPKSGRENDLDCITHHPGLSSVCLDRYMLETAYFHALQLQGTSSMEEGGGERRNASEHK